jgi:hypothetical protein
MSDSIRKELEESSIREIMQQLSMSEAEAREHRAAFVRKYYANKERVYGFLRAHNPKTIEMEESGAYTSRIRQVCSEMGVSEATARALVVGPELIRPGALRLLRKHRRLRKKKSTPEDIQEMLGVTVPIPKDVWDALGMDDA